MAEDSGGIKNLSEKTVCLRRSSSKGLMNKRKRQQEKNLGSYFTHLNMDLVHPL